MGVLRFGPEEMITKLAGIYIEPHSIPVKTP
jgi:hypothetical protein